jgi:hypothetical protein
VDDRSFPTFHRGAFLAPANDLTRLAYAHAFRAKLVDAFDQSPFDLWRPFRGSLDSLRDELETWDVIR